MWKGWDPPVQGGALLETYLLISVGVQGQAHAGERAVPQKLNKLVPLSHLRRASSPVVARFPVESEAYSWTSV